MRRRRRGRRPLRASDPCRRSTRRPSSLEAQRIRQWMEQAVASVAERDRAAAGGVRVRAGLPGAADALARSTSRRAGGRRGRRAAAGLRGAVPLPGGRWRRGKRSAPRRPGRRRGLGGPGELVGRWIESLPFEPTGDQRARVRRDRRGSDSGAPMQRLLMGEVGSGKTVVALYAMLRALEAGYQAVLMAPTETLAEQHAATLDRLLAGEPVPFALLTGARCAARRKEALEPPRHGRARPRGRHPRADRARRRVRPARASASSTSSTVSASRQRAALDAKGPGYGAPRPPHDRDPDPPHALADRLRRPRCHRAPRAARRPEAGGDPPGRRRTSRAGAYEFLRERAARGPPGVRRLPARLRVGRNCRRERRTEEARRLAAGELRDFRVGVMHGQMPSRTKHRGDGGFAVRATDVLVATTVIEVGIDVPNATVMLIEGASATASPSCTSSAAGSAAGPAVDCLLFAEAAAEMARRRLEAVVRERDGFKLAEVDLSLRGEGEILGTRQHGLPRFAHRRAARGCGGPARGSRRGAVAAQGARLARRP